MKKTLTLILCILLVLAFVCSCSEKNNVETDENEKVDIDITQLSSTVAYSLVVNMCNTPDEYLGKTVKMQGNFGTYQDPETQKMYYACLFVDNTACCTASIEFETAKKLSYPTDYPGNGELITVMGVFDTYYEGEYRYCYLKDAIIIASSIARNQHSELIIHRQNGQIRDRDSYGNDPYPPKG